MGIARFGQALSPRQQDICRQICLGKANKEIGPILKISDKTVKNHLSVIFVKLGIKNRVGIPSACVKTLPIEDLSITEKRVRYMSEGSFPIVEEYLRNHPEVKVCE